MSSSVKHCLQKKKKSDMVVHTLEPSSQEVEAKDCHKFRANLVYKPNFRLGNSRLGLG